jgi:hypothetical protein
MDWPAKLADVRMTGDGRISRGRKGIRSTYRAFGTLVRNWSGRRVRNMAAVLVALPVATPEEQHAAEVLAKDAHSPRACAVNAFLRSGEQTDTVIFRTRLVDGVRTFVAPVTETHSREDSDDPVMIDALRTGFMEVLVSNSLKDPALPPPAPAPPPAPPLVAGPPVTSVMAARAPEVTPVAPLQVEPSTGAPETPQVPAQGASGGVDAPKAPSPTTEAQKGSPKASGPGGRTGR